MTAQALAQDVFAHLQSKGVPPTPAWLNSFLTSQKNSVPPTALKQTALFRLIQTDLTKTIQRVVVAEFPSDIQNANIRERQLPGPIPVQVLDVDDIGRSKWSQVEAIEAEERGETTKGREIIRAVPRDDGEPDISSSGPHKLLLQDARGARMYAMELSSIDGIGLGMNIGSKLVLRDVRVARGVLLLRPESVTLLGGKIDELHQKWRASRKDFLKAAAQEDSTE
jgi:RecQ-mediated genome instability protein 1